MSMKRVLLSILVDGLVVAAAAWGLHLAVALAIPSLVAVSNPSPALRDLMAGPPAVISEPIQAEAAGTDQLPDRVRGDVELETTVLDLHAQAAEAIKHGDFELAEILLAEARLILLNSQGN